MTDIFKLPVLEAANVFPMMADDELEELSKDIKQNGQREPIVVAVVDDKTTLIDGRNRRAACKMAGVVPAIRHLDGEDPTAFVISANIHRRHMTKGQRAMAVAMIYPETSQGKKTSESNSEVVSRRYINMARSVLEHAPGLAASVLAGASLNDAYDEAMKRKKKDESEESQLAKLRGRYSDLADKVVEDELTMEGAYAEAIARDKRESTARMTIAHSMDDATRMTSDFANADFVKKAATRLSDEEVRAGIMEHIRGGEAALLARLDDFVLGSKNLRQLLRKMKG